MTNAVVVKDIHQEPLEKGDVVFIDGYVRGNDGITYAVAIRVDDGVFCLAPVQSIKAIMSQHDKIGLLQEQPQKWINGKVVRRRLTINEMERLQTLPDNYTKAVSVAQRSRMIGNGWTVDVIAHILKHITKGPEACKKV
jgi:site-specific DNA-cytosine methylase